MVAGPSAEPPTDPTAAGVGPAADWVTQPRDDRPRGADRGQGGPARFSGPAREHDAMPGPAASPASVGEPSPGAGAGRSAGPGPETADPGLAPAGPGPGTADPRLGPAGPGPETADPRMAPAGPGPGTADPRLGPAGPGPETADPRLAPGPGRELPIRALGPLVPARELPITTGSLPALARRPPCGVRPWPGCRPQAMRGRPRAWCYLAGGRPSQEQNRYSCCAPISPGRPCCGSCSMRIPGWLALPTPGWRGCVPSSPACGHSSRAGRCPPTG